MAENVFEVIRRDNPALILKLDENHDVCAFLMGAYAHILNLAQQDLRNPRDIRLSYSIEGDRILKITIRYVFNESSSADVGDALPRQRNLNLVKLLTVNNSVKNMALEVTYLLEKWVSDPAYQFRGKYEFRHIVMLNSMLWTGDPREITSELVVKAEFDNSVCEKMGWDQEGEKPEGSKLIQ